MPAGNRQSLEAIMVGKLKCLALLLAVASLLAGPAFADAFTDSASFQAAIAGLGTASTGTIDDLAAGTVISAGGTADGITFHDTPAVGTANLAISNLFDTTSSPNYLGSDDPTTNAFFAGDSITMSFAAPIRALGMFIILASDSAAGDFTLDIGSAQAASSGVVQQTLLDNGQVLFLGITGQTDFSSATLSLNSNAGYIWNVDDIVSAPTPEPGTVTLLATGLALFLRRIRKS